MNGDLLDWDLWWPRLKLGIHEIDDQHRWLIHTARTFDADASLVRRKEVLLELIRYSREHFRAEEELMRLNGYEGLDRHCKAHDRLLEDLIDFANRNLDDPGTMEQFHAFVKDWLFDHILAMDVVMAESLRSKRN